MDYLFFVWKNIEDVLTLEGDREVEESEIVELVYYWIEEWKNIKHQGFNLSSKYEFEFDRKKIEKCEETDKENEVYFFNYKKLVEKKMLEIIFLVKIFLMLLYY